MSKMQIQVIVVTISTLGDHNEPVMNTGTYESQADAEHAIIKFANNQQEYMNDNEMSDILTIDEAYDYINNSDCRVQIFETMIGADL